MQPVKRRKRSMEGRPPLATNSSKTKQKMVAPIGELKVLISGWHWQLIFHGATLA
jgi:hypothetical protein